VTHWNVCVRGASVRFGSVDALDDVTLDLEAGHAQLLAGPNGAGKSTLIKVLLGLVRPDFATFEVDAERVAVDNEWKQHIGYLPESVAFSEVLSGRQLLRFFAQARGVASERIDGVLERVGLADARKRAIRGYSRGMRQRLGLAVAILSTPQLLILDEPTSGLDQEGLQVLWSVIDEWRANKRIVLISSHDLALMERRVDEICLLRAGRVIAHGTASDLRKTAGLPHRIFLEVSDPDDPRVALLCTAIGKWGRARVERSELGVLAAVPGDGVLELMKIQGGFPGLVTGVRVEEPTLDLVYEKLLGVA
jgi:Cu-processing system ATP-binding protein